MSREGSPEPGEAPVSSPPLPSSPPQKLRKPRKPPPITPNRFNRFFNPRSSSSTSSRASRALKELTASDTNRANGSISRDAHDDSLATTPRKRVRLSNSDQVFSSSPPLSSPCGHHSVSKLAENEEQYPKPIARSKLQSSKTDRFCYSSNIQTADFVSTRQDRHVFSRAQLPFCTAACHTNSLVAIGTERGEVHLLESANDAKPPFEQAYLQFTPHNNAIMDLAFTSDDERLASASGDQSARITDMRTQTIVYVLAEHSSSLKQVHFQPDNENIVATCSRDSVVALWDLRCANTGPAIQSITSNGSSDSRVEVTLSPRYPTVYKSISNWHYDVPASHTLDFHNDPTPNSTPTSSAEVSKPSSSERAISRGTASITSMAFLPQSPHHIVTSSDASCRLRVWDIRSRLLSTRRRSATPIQLPVATSAPAPQYSKGRHRDYGTTSLTLSTDAARLYAVSRDNSVQVYSTQHLILGQQLHESSHERSSQPKTLRPKTPIGLSGAPPIYTLRDPNLRVASFYVRASIRRTSPHSNWPELLAVGSSDGHVILFPTDSSPRHAKIDTVKQGESLVHGHKKEVTGLSWTSDGELVSCADDYTARVWREDRAKAKELRAGRRKIDETGAQIQDGCGWSYSTQSVAHESSDLLHTLDTDEEEA